MWSDPSSLDTQQRRVIAAAHARGVRVTGHCAYPLALVAAGIDSKEHLGWPCTMHDVGTWYDDLIRLYRAAAEPQGEVSGGGPRAGRPTRLRRRRTAWLGFRRRAGESPRIPQFATASTRDGAPVVEV